MTDDTRWDHALKVTSDGEGLAGQAGAVLLRKLADQAGLAAALGSALARAGKFPPADSDGGGALLVGQLPRTSTPFLPRRSTLFAAFGGCHSWWRRPGRPNATMTTPAPGLPQQNADHPSRRASGAEERSDYGQEVEDPIGCHDMWSRASHGAGRGCIDASTCCRSRYRCGVHSCAERQLGGLGKFP